MGFLTLAFLFESSFPNEFPDLTSDEGDYPAHNGAVGRDSKVVMYLATHLMEESAGCLAT